MHSFAFCIKWFIMEPYHSNINWKLLFLIISHHYKFFRSPLFHYEMQSGYLDFIYNQHGSEKPCISSVSIFMRLVPPLREITEAFLMFTSNFFTETVMSFPLQSQPTATFKLLRERHFEVWETLCRRHKLLPSLEYLSKSQPQGVQSWVTAKIIFQGLPFNLQSKSNRWSCNVHLRVHKMGVLWLSAPMVILRDALAVLQYLCLQAEIEGSTKWNRKNH